MKYKVISVAKIGDSFGVTCSLNKSTSIPKIGYIASQNNNSWDVLKVEHRDSFMGNKLNFFSMLLEGNSTILENEMIEVFAGIGA